MYTTSTSFMHPPVPLYNLHPVKQLPRDASADADADGFFLCLVCLDPILLGGYHAKRNSSLSYILLGQIFELLQFCCISFARWGSQTGAAYSRWGRTSDTYS